MLNADLGNLNAAAKALNEYLMLEDDESQRIRATALIKNLRKQLN